MVPLKAEGDRLFVAMSDPMDYITVDDFTVYLLVFISRRQLLQKMILCERFQNIMMKNHLVSCFIEQTAEQIEQQEELTDIDSPIVRLVNQICLQLLHKRQVIFISIHKKIRLLFVFVLMAC